jgi:type II secretory pathway pseudopilin PulG
MKTSAARAPLSRRGLGEGGFTLVEVILVLALLVLIISVLLPAAGTLLRGARGETAEETALTVLQDARRQAVISGREVALRYEPAEHALVWTDGVQDGRRVLEQENVTVEFLRPGGGAILLGGQLVEADPVDEMKFYADGSCDLIRLQLRATDAAPRVISIDPWTCAPVLAPAA